MHRSVHYRCIFFVRITEKPKPSQNLISVLMEWSRRSSRSLMWLHGYSPGLPVFLSMKYKQTSDTSVVSFVFIVPSSCPQNFSVVDALYSSLLLTWTPIPPEDRNGVILGYDVVFMDHLTNQNETIKVNGSEQLEYKKTNIKKHYNYLITIAGRTSVGVSDVKNSVKISNLAKGGLFWMW